MADILKHPDESEFTFSLFVDGKLISTSTVYDYIMNRGLGIALYLKCDFENSRAPLVVDKWKSEEHLIIISKSK